MSMAKSMIKQYGRTPHASARVELQLLHTVLLAEWVFMGVRLIAERHFTTPHHCCQLKSSLFPNTKKKPNIVEKMTVFPVRTSAHAPQRITAARANTIGSPNAETTIPVVRNMASSLQALLAASVSSTALLAMQYGMGASM